MKKTISLLLSIVMLFSITAGTTLTAQAGGWLDNVKEIELNTTYTDSCDATDYYLSYYYYDSFKFNVDLKGTINLYIESENPYYFYDSWYPAFYYIYNANDTTNYLYKFSGNYYYDSGRGMYFISEDFSLPKGLYYLVAKYYYGEHDGTYNFSLNFKADVTKPSTFKVSTRNTTSLKLSWSKVGGVSGYQLQQKSGDTWKTKVTTTATSATLSKLTAGKSYSFRVRAYKTINGTKYYSSWKTLTTCTKPAKVTLSKLTAYSSGHKIKASWKKVSGYASGYQIYWAKDKSFKKVVAKTTVSGQSKTSYTGKNFTKGKKYYVKVRAYKVVNGTKYYGSWSNVKSITCK
ncbi:MAG: fibronectin type III domain-containing protein [Eubacterium sp.]